jgi:hypothetical protein
MGSDGGRGRGIKYEHMGENIPVNYDHKIDIM